MKSQKNLAYSVKNTPSGFTLIEFLIVMTLMGIFGGIILPFGKKIINRAHLVADKTRLSYLVA